MSDKQTPDLPPLGGGDPEKRRSSTVSAIIVLIVVLCIGMTWWESGSLSLGSTDVLATSEFVTAVKEGRVATATYKTEDASISGLYRPATVAEDEGTADDAKGVEDESATDDESVSEEVPAEGAMESEEDPSAGVSAELRAYTSVYLGSDSLAELMADHPEVLYDIDTSSSAMLETILVSVVPTLLLLGVFVFYMNRMSSQNDRTMAFGKTKAKTNEATRPKVRFSDVAGIDEAVEELQEVRDFLSEPARYQAMGARIPHGVLLVGPPGTGKTLLAKAVAGEAGVPFFSISGSDFVEMFVGVGASRVRDLFKQAKQDAPCIIFIDEIDAVGRQRGAGLGGGHDEREQTLNQLLVEMDGFEDNSAVILIAATNRPDILDPALLRPGRFDRQITVDRPDVGGREKILRVHAEGKPLELSVDFERLAKITPGFTGADLANLMNEAALLAARARKARIGQEEIEEAMERVMAGPERKSRIITEKERRIIAYHESGHALVGHVLENSDPIHKISIISRGQALGYTMQVPEEDHFLETRDGMLDKIAVLMGGRTAEELFCDDITSGASNDLERATKLARAMVMSYGMSDQLGAQVFGEAQHEVFLGRDYAAHQDYSAETAKRIDDEVERILKEAHDRARAVLGARRAQMDTMADVLLERETVEGDVVDALLEDRWAEYVANESAPAEEALDEPAPAPEPADTLASAPEPAAADEPAPEPADEPAPEPAAADEPAPAPTDES